MSKIRLHGSSSGYMEIAPPAAGSSETITLPNSAGEVLLSDGSAASLTQIPAANIVGVATAGFGNGTLQVVQTVKTDTFSFSASATGNTSGGVSGAAISASITPSSASNKVLIRGVLSVSCSNNNRIGIVIYADGTEISGSVGDASSSRSRVATGGQLISSSATAQHLMLGHEFLHSPSSTSSVTYSYRLVNLDSNNSRTLYLNRGKDDSDAAHHFRSTSIITLEEIAA